MSVFLSRRSFSAGVAALVAATARPAWAAERPILTVTGRVRDGSATFDRAALESLGLATIETNTPWHSGRVRFEGVPMRTLMRHVGADGTTVQALALNDYSTTIPIEDFERYNVIMALKRDGEYMPVRDKGPLFIVYPYDSDPDLRSQRFYSRSAWQVKQLTVS